MRFLSSVSWSRCLDIVQVRFVVILRSLSKHVFELRTSTGSVVFFPPLCLYATKFVLLSVFTHKKKICLRIRAKTLPVDFRLTFVARKRLYLSSLLWAETKSRSIKTEKRTRLIFSPFDLVIKGFTIITKKRTFSCGINA